MLTVLFATRDGANRLPTVLEAFCNLRPPHGGWRLVVVDNGSRDQSREILASFLTKLPLTCLFEPRSGKNQALNTGLPDITGDLAVFTDDDAVPHPDWLVHIRRAADARPEYTIFGGVVAPRWAATPPAWVLEWVPLGPVFTLTPPTLRDGPTASNNIFGPNMAIRAEVFAGGQRFDTTIGPRGASYPMGSETELVRRLMRDGCLAWHVHDAVVEHMIRRHQLQQAWILARAVRFGRGQYRLAVAVEGPPVVSWAGIPRYLFRDLAQHAIGVARGLATFDRERVFRARWGFNYTRGQLMEARSLRRPGRLAGASVDPGRG